MMGNSDLNGIFFEARNIGERGIECDTITDINFEWW